MTIKEEPMNANQLGEVLGVDYRTIRHHLEILEKNKLVTSMGERYGKIYFLSVDLEQNFVVFQDIWEKIEKQFTI
jgi:DNA-binding transcriptional ArsR family regulator